MKVATLEKFNLRGANQDPGDPGVGKVRGGKGFFFLQAGGVGGGMTLDDNGMTLKPCPQMEYQIKKHFYRKTMQKMCSKSYPRPLYNFGK